MLKVSVLGAGSWGTAISQHLANNGVVVKLWGRNASQIAAISKNRENSKYLPNITLSENIIATNDLVEAINETSALILCLPSGSTRTILEEIKQKSRFENNRLPIISTAKGLEKESNKRISQVISDVFEDKHPNFVISGPSFALEVAKGLPTAIVLAREGENFAEEFSFSTRLFHRGSMRIYTSQDLIGVELGGILKNIIAIASGIGDGLELGMSARAALLTRGLKELILLVEAEGGSRKTAAGLSGLGDLILTATGELSRNRRFGIYLGQGHSIETAKEMVGQTIEAVTTARSALELANKKGIEVPIIEQVAELLSGKTTPLKALQDLMTRDQKSE